MHAPPHRSHGSPHFRPAHGSGHDGGASTHCSPAHQPSATVHCVPEQGISQRTPHASPAHDLTGGGQKFGVGGAPTHVPAGSHRPTMEGTMHGGVALRQGGSTVHASPHVFPAQAALAGSHPPKAGRETQRRSRLHAFRSAVSTQSGSPGAHWVHASPHAFPAHGSYGPPPPPQPRWLPVVPARTSASEIARNG